jgi:hypothetical protein
MVHRVEPQRHLSLDDYASDFRTGGVANLGVEDSRFAWARFYLDPVDVDASGRTP